MQVYTIQTTYQFSSNFSVFAENAEAALNKAEELMKTTDQQQSVIHQAIIGAGDEHDFEPRPYVYSVNLDWVVDFDHNNGSLGVFLSRAKAVAFLDAKVKEMLAKGETWECEVQDDENYEVETIKENGTDLLSYWSCYLKGYDDEKHTTFYISKTYLHV